MLYVLAETQKTNCLEEQRKKIFEKKQSNENIGGLAYLLNTYKQTHGSGFVSLGL